jgi:hypothetical protein
MRIAALLAAALLLASPLAKAQNAEPCLSGVSILINNTTGPQMKAPYTAVIKETFDQKLADGNSIHGTVHYRIARDSAGRTMFEMPLNCYTSDDGRRHQAYQVNVFDRTTNTNETWHLPGDELPKIATIYHMPTQQPPSPAEIAAMKANAHAQQAAMSEWQTEKLGIREFQGISATGTRRTQTIPAGEEGNALPLVMVDEFWISRDLNLTMMAIRDDPRRGRATAEIEELHQGDPDPAIFSPPEGYIIKDQNPQPATVTGPQ